MSQPLTISHPLDQPEFFGWPAFTIRQDNKLAWIQVSACLAQNSPMPIRSGLKKQPLPAPASPSSSAHQLSEYDLGIVQHQPVALRQQLWQVANVIMVDQLPATVYEHQAGIRAAAQRLLSDEPAGHFIIE